MKTIIITSFHPLISRNVVSTDVIPRLIRGGDVRVVVVVPDYKKQYFEKTYGQANVAFEGVDVGPNARSAVVRMFKRLSEAMPNTRRAALGRRRLHSGGKKPFFIYLLGYAPAGLLGRIPGARWLMRFLDSKLTPRGRFSELLERYRPAVVFSTDVQNEHDVALMQDADERGIPVVGMVRSWDNLTTRLLRFIPGRLIVHNDIIKSEAMSINGVSSSRIVVTGIPHYDRYRSGPTITRLEFLRTLGLDPQKKLIVYVPICDFRIYDNFVDPFILEILSGIDANVLVRFPPTERIDLRGFVKPPHMIYDQPGQVFREEVTGDCDVTPADDERLVNMLAWCDLVIAGPSTVIIDAALFDKPILLVDFYPRDVKPDERIHEYGAEHMAPILASGGVRVARSKEEFSELIWRYFMNPELDRDGRRRIVAEQCGSVDGRAGERVAEFLLKQMSYP